MAGIYVHVPFCREACSYCNFHFTTSFKTINFYHQALLNEIQTYKDCYRVSNLVFDTIYFGGGTPSVLSNNQLQQIIDSLKNNFNLSQSLQEVTLEVNPDDYSFENALAWKNMGFDRVSLGIQSLNNTVLKIINRKHTVQQCFDAIEGLNKFGFKLSIDLIYGLPSQTSNDWESELESILKYSIDHISAYGLMIEKNTLLSNQVAKNLTRIASDEDFFRMYESLINMTRNLGYEHYEVSSFALDGKYAKHNSSYWNFSSYIGLGPSAHSYLFPNHRFANKSSNAAYINKFYNKTDIDIVEDEFLTPSDLKKEKLLIGLRTNKGVSLEHFSAIEVNKIIKALDFYPKDNYVFKDNFVILTDKGMFISDTIISTLFKCIVA